MSSPDSQAVPLPPFPPKAVAPEEGDPGPHHPSAEAFINTTAQHVFPESQNPAQNDAPPTGEEKSKVVSRDSDHPDDFEEDQEQPLIGGTPLEDMQTPMLERPGMNFARHREVGEGDKSGLGVLPKPEVPTPVPEDEEMSMGMTPSVKQESSTARPGFGVAREIGSVRMGASALISALNALPWEGDDDSSSSSDDEAQQGRGRVVGGSMRQTRDDRPKASRLHSSLHTIRPASTSTHLDPNDPKKIPAQAQQDGQGNQSFYFPFRQNTIARRARSPGPPELNYQFDGSQITGNETQLRRDSGDVPLPRGFDPDTRRTSEESDGGLPVGGDARKLVDERVRKEEAIGEEEENEEMLRAAESDNAPSIDLGAVVGDDRPSDENTAAALREDDQDPVPAESMGGHGVDRKLARKEMLSDRLMEVFGLEEKEEVLEEMRCWLLRSIMLKGYMYVTKRRICFFAQMPNRENFVVKTGPLSKKSARTKLNTKFWVTLRNDVLSWFESTADPYFPKGNVSLLYASSCDSIDETRFKLRTSERNYTFTAESEASKDEWMKAIQKVMFKAQHEGENVKLIIPLEAVLEIEKSPTLEFAETIEIKCVDPEDQMSVDSYFFASFQDNDHAFAAIQRQLDERPSSELPRVLSNLSLQTTETEPSTATVKSEESSGSSSLRKIGSVFKPLIPRNDKSDSSDTSDSKSGFSIPFISKSHKASHDSLDTLRREPSNGPLDEEELDGYPPRQTGAPPRGMPEEGGKPAWSGWIRKPAAKIFGSSPNQSSPQTRSSADSHVYSGLTDTPTRARTGRAKRASVQEVVERVASSTDDESDDDYGRGTSRRQSDQRSSFRSEESSGSQMGHNYSMMEQSESGNREEAEIANKFRSVFSLTEKEELIDHFPGYLFRVLPVSGRFFVSTNYFCFRSSQLLYKTKMIIPIRDLYGLKAQKAFRFDHSGLIVVIKGHEELFLEFSSSKRRAACVKLLEQRMEEVRTRGESGQDVDMRMVEARIMEDLDESTAIESRSTGPPTSPNPMFGSTTSTFLEFKPEPMRVTCLTIGSRGDVQPYIALCKGLQAEGHSTKIATHGEYKDWVEGHGIEFASVGGDPAELMQMCVDNGMFTVSFLKEGLQKFRGWLDDLLNSSWRACQDSDLLIESPSAMGGIHIAEALQIPYYRAFTMPWTRTRAYPHAFAVPEHKRGGAYNYMTYTMFDQVFWRAISGQVNRWRKHVMNIDPTNFDKLEQHKVPFLYNFSPSVVPQPLDWTEWIHVTGYWFLENADESAEKKKWSPPEGLLDFIDNAHKIGKKVVYIGFGSIVVSDPEEMTRCVVDAVVDSGVCAILSKGWSDRGSKSKGETSGDAQGADGVKYPDEIFSIDSIDHSWLFPRIDAACHHGGAGTSGASLSAGIPTIIKPFFGDQAFWSERVESLNVGSAVRKLTSEALAEALRKATTDEKQVAKAKIVGEMIRKENGVAKAIEAIYRDLEYAKSLIKPLPVHEESSLDKVTTTLLHPLTSHSEISAFGRVRSNSSPKKPRSRLPSQDQEPGSDGSWSVVSESGNGEGVALEPPVESSR